MFILTKISDTVPIVPSDFEKRTRQAIEDNINEKYANKVIQRVGLCICFYDLLSASDGLIDNRSGDGTVHVTVTFRLLVFRPFKGEILEGRVKSSTPAGIRITLAFFDDVAVPPAHLFGGTRFDAAEGVFVWTTTAGAGAQYFFDENERVRLRVEDELWQDQAPSGKRDAAVETGAARAAVGVERADGVGAGMGALERDEVKNQRAPWRIVASMNQAGLGQLEWW